MPRFARVAEFLPRASRAIWVASLAAPALDAEDPLEEGLYLLSWRIWRRRRMAVWQADMGGESIMGSSPASMGEDSRAAGIAQRRNPRESPPAGRIQSLEAATPYSPVRSCNQGSQSRSGERSDRSADISSAGGPSRCTWSREAFSLIINSLGAELYKLVRGCPRRDASLHGSDI